MRADVSKLTGSRWSPLFSSASTPRSERLPLGAGFDELFRLTAGHDFHHAAEIEAARIERPVLDGCHAFWKAFIGNTDRRGLGALCRQMRR
jgi:hypothetical protein